MGKVRDAVDKLLRITTAGAMRAADPSASTELVTDYVQKAQIFQNLGDAIDDTATLTGSGDPNAGAVAANSSLLYIDTATDDLWINKVVGATSGWINKG